MKKTTLAALAALATGIACGGPETPALQTSDVNVLLISIDTLRADHLGAYGYDKPTSPNIDRFTDDAVLFSQAMAHAPSTLHSHASILSSLLPHHHRASWGAKARLPNAVVSLPEVLKETGYQTFALTGGGQMDRVFGLDQGFDAYEQPGTEKFNGTVSRAIELLDARSEAPFLLFLHSYEPHHPYAPDPEFFEIFDTGYSGELPNAISVDLLREINTDQVEIDDEGLAHIVATYDAEIRSMDAAFGRLVEYLKANGLYDDTMIVFTSDHGEEFGEHGRIGWHSHSLYDELLQVPLIVKLPANARAGETVESLVRSLDIAPTILEVVGIKAPADFTGIALFADDAEARGELTAISRLDRKASRNISSVRTERWKLYRNQLFDLEQDPYEQWDTAINYSGVVTELNQLLDETIAAREAFEEEQVVPDDQTLEELRALGYLQ